MVAVYTPETQTLRSFWVKYTHNFGDILTPFILRHLGYNVVGAGKNAPYRLLAVGSILSQLRKFDIVWGSGGIYTRKVPRVRPPEGVEFLAVRGPKTREIVDADVPEVYGDPALLLPQMYQPATPAKRYPVGIIPHEAEKDIPVPTDDPSVLVIDINAGIAPVIDAIAQCEVILSSTLHGIITAEAYGIPATWLRMTDRIRGGDFKFHDYYLSTGRDTRPPVMWGDDMLSAAVEAVAPPIVYDPKPLIDALHTRFPLGG